MKDIVNFDFMEVTVVREKCLFSFFVFGKRKSLSFADLSLLKQQHYTKVENVETYNMKQ